MLDGWLAGALHLCVCACPAWRTHTHTYTLHTTAVCPAAAGSSWMQVHVSHSGIPKTWMKQTVICVLECYPLFFLPVFHRYFPLSRPCALPNFTPFSLVSAFFSFPYFQFGCFSLSLVGTCNAVTFIPRNRWMIWQFSLRLNPLSVFMKPAISFIYPTVLFSCLISSVELKKRYIFFIMQHCSRTYMLPPLQSVKMVQAMHWDSPSWGSSSECAA